MEKIGKNLDADARAMLEEAPVHEAEQLQQDLASAGIRPFAWGVTQSLFASGTADPLLAERGRCEVPYVRRVAEALSSSRMFRMGRWPQSPTFSLGIHTSTDL